MSVVNQDNNLDQVHFEHVDVHADTDEHVPAVENILRKPSSKLHEYQRKLYMIITKYLYTTMEDDNMYITEEDEEQINGENPKATITDVMEDEIADAIAEQIQKGVDRRTMIGIVYVPRTGVWYTAAVLFYFLHDKRGYRNKNYIPPRVRASIYLYALAFLDKNHETFTTMDDSTVQTLKMNSIRIFFSDEKVRNNTVPEPETFDALHLVLPNEEEVHAAYVKFKTPTFPETDDLTILKLIDNAQNQLRMADFLKWSYKVRDVRFRFKSVKDRWMSHSNRYCRDANNANGAQSRSESKYVANANSKPNGNGNKTISNIKCILRSHLRIIFDMFHSNSGLRNLCPDIRTLFLRKRITSLTNIGSLTINRSNDTRGADGTGTILPDSLEYAEFTIAEFILLAAFLVTDHPKLGEKNVALTALFIKEQLQDLLGNINNTEKTPLNPRPSMFSGWFPFSRGGGEGPATGQVQEYYKVAYKYFHCRGDSRYVRSGPSVRAATHWMSRWPSAPEAGKTVEGTVLTSLEGKRSAAQDHENEARNTVRIMLEHAHAPSGLLSVFKYALFESKDGSSNDDLARTMKLFYIFLYLLQAFGKVDDPSPEDENFLRKAEQINHHIGRAYVLYDDFLVSRGGQERRLPNDVVAWMLASRHVLHYKEWKTKLLLTTNGKPYQSSKELKALYDDLYPTSRRLPAGRQAKAMYKVSKKRDAFERAIHSSIFSTRNSCRARPRTSVSMPLLCGNDGLADRLRAIARVFSSASDLAKLCPGVNRLLIGKRIRGAVARAESKLQQSRVHYKEPTPAAADADDADEVKFTLEEILCLFNFLAFAVPGSTFDNVNRWSPSSRELLQLVRKELIRCVRIVENFTGRPDGR